MIKPAYLNIFLTCAWSIVTGGLKKLPKRYEKYLSSLINNLGLTIKNLVISLYYLYKHSLNDIVSVDVSDNGNLPIYLILTSLILSNKVEREPQPQQLQLQILQVVPEAYTYQEWHNACNEISTNKLNILVQLLEILENHFRSCINNDLAVQWEDVFWDFIAQHTNIHWMNILKQEIQSK